MTVGEQIYCIRTERQLSTGDFARMIGVERNLVAKWEVGLADPTDEQLDAVCARFGLDKYALFPRSAAVRPAEEFHSVELKEPAPDGFQKEKASESALRENSSRQAEAEPPLGREQALAKEEPVKKAEEPLPRGETFDRAGEKPFPPPPPPFPDKRGGARAFALYVLVVVGALTACCVAGLVYLAVNEREISASTELFSFTYLHATIVTAVLALLLVIGLIVFFASMRSGRKKKGKRK